MAGLLKGLDKVDSFIESIETYIIITLFTVMSVSAFCQVLFRYVLHIVFPASEEIARLAMVSMTFIGAALATRLDNHIRLDFLDAFLTPTMKEILKVIVDVFTIIVVGVFFSWGVEFVTFAFATNQLTAALEMPYWIPMSTIAIGMGLSIFHIVVRNLKKVVPKAQSNSVKAGV